jgi:hypothetical protein
MSNLVDRLSSGTHPVSALRYESGEDFAAAVARGFVLVQFTETRGGTELGLKVAADRGSSDLMSPSGKIQLVGALALDGVPVECVVEIDIQTRTGAGSLRPLR